ncbi:MAG: ubiquitin-like domain-containing protein [Faecalibacterium sp.]|jgi:hypothetical protein|nr:ubiquitin-like domain-containing protein [Faecalibacterium sp.]
MACKALTEHTLPKEELDADLAGAQKIGDSAVGQKALYLPGRLLARARYVPLAALERAYLRLVVGEKRHGNFQQPLLVLKIDGKEQVYLYTQEKTVRDILAALEEKGIAIGKPAAPKPN